MSRVVKYKIFGKSLCDFPNISFLYFRLHSNIILTTEKHVFLIKHVFRESGRLTDLVQKHFPDKFSDTLATGLEKTIYLKNCFKIYFIEYKR